MFGVFFFVITCSGFQPGHVPKLNKMDAKRALITAVRFFDDKDFGSIASYRITMAENTMEWKVFFVKEKPLATPGGHFTIVVPKVKGEAKLFKGE